MDNRFGKSLKAARSQLNLTQEELAARLGKSKSWVANLELERTVPTDHETIQEISRVLQLNPTKLRAQALHASIAGGEEWTFLWEDVSESLHGWRDADHGAQQIIERCAPRSFNEISNHAQRIVSTRFPQRAEEGRAVPIVEAMETLADNWPGVVFRSDIQDDSFDGEGCTFYSADTEKIVVSVRKDVWELAKQNDGRARFTCAHELAHALLHEQELRTEQGQMFRDQTCTANAQKPEHLRYYEWPEWQANSWASVFLMPEEGVRRYLQLKKKMKEDFSISDMAENFQVSVQAARIRLEKLIPTLME